jgi:transcriptional regulator with XRE-family HTH domain
MATKKKSKKAQKITPSALPKFAKLLREVRQLKNWSLRDVQKRSGDHLSRQTVLRAEQGDVELGTLIQLTSLYALKTADKDALMLEYHRDALTKAKAVIKEARVP